MEKKQQVPVEESHEIELIIPSVVIEVSTVPENDQRNENQHAEECQCRVCEHYRREEERRRKKKKSCFSCLDSEDDQLDRLVLFSCDYDDNGSGCCYCCCECLDNGECCDCDCDCDDD